MSSQQRKWMRMKTLKISQWKTDYQHLRKGTPDPCPLFQQHPISRVVQHYSWKWRRTESLLPDNCYGQYAWYRPPHKVLWGHIHQHKGCCYLFTRKIKERKINNENAIREPNPHNKSYFHSLKKNKRRRERQRKGEQREREIDKDR